MFFTLVTASDYSVNVGEIMTFKRFQNFIATLYLCIYHPSVSESYRRLFLHLLKFACLHLDTE